MVKLMVGGLKMPRHGENIWKRKDGRWEGRYKLPTGTYNNKAKTKYRSVYGRTYTDVKKKLNDAISQTNAFKMVITEQSSEEQAEKWLDFIMSRCKYSTYVKYSNIYHEHLQPYFQNTDIFHSTETELQDILIAEYTKDGKKLSLSTMNGLKLVMNQILAYARVNIKVSIPDIIIADNKYSDKHVFVFTSSEQQKLISFLQYRTDTYKAGILLCLYSGLRLGELCALQSDNVDINNRTLKITQTVQRIKRDGEAGTYLYCTPPKSVSSIREIPLCDEIISYIPDMSLSHKYLINGDRLMEPRTYQYKYKRYLHDAGIPYKNFHTLRHTFATNCIAHGMDVKCLSEILGHSDVKTTMNKYVHPSMENKRDQLNQCISNFGQ
jgi:integrase